MADYRSPKPYRSAAAYQGPAEPRRLEVYGIAPPPIGAQAVLLRTRWLIAGGADASVFGVARVEDAIRFLEPIGAGFAALGAPWVSRSPREIAPEGAPFPIDRSTHEVGGLRWIGADGFVATRFGPRIIPEVQVTYPDGMEGEVGHAFVRNRIHYVAPVGAAYSEERNRWGWAYAWNSTQYISQGFSSTGGLSPPAWPLWASIANRNKVVATFGATMASLGRPFVYNNASPLFPATMAPTSQPKALLVAYRIRSFDLDGLDPAAMSRWAIVRNNAVLVRPAGTVASLFGRGVVESNRRTVSRAGGVDIVFVPTPFIADRVRSIVGDGRYAIAPKMVPLPIVQLSTRYIDQAPKGIEPKELGRASLQIIWRGIVPRWTHRDYFGEPRLHNVTPEVHGKGWGADEFGSTALRLEWRPVGVVQGQSFDLFGATRISDTQQAVLLAGANFLRIGDKLKVERFGIQPPSPQTIIVGNASNTFIDLGHQVSKPSVNQQTIYPDSEREQTKFGGIRVTANSIRVEPGYWEQLVGDHAVTLKIRRVTVKRFPDAEVHQPTGPRLSPHTIYSVAEAPQQAKDNHPRNNLHYVNSRGWERAPGEVFGLSNVELKHRVIKPAWYDPYPSIIGSPSIKNRRSYIKPTGALSLRMGMLVVPGPRTITADESHNSALYGAATVAFAPYFGPQTINTIGIAAGAVQAPSVDYFNRMLAVQGFDSVAMGESRYEPRLYMPQSLYVGPPILIRPAGALTELFGASWVSHWVREIQGQGFDAFLCEYDYTAFAQRMRVRNAQDGMPPRRFLQHQGRDCAHVGAPALRHGTHHIRPDGNSDQHRKGVFSA